MSSTVPRYLNSIHIFDLSCSSDQLQPYPPPQSVMIFLKYFDASKQTVHGVGRVYVAKATKISDLILVINERMHWTHSTPLKLYEVSYPRYNLSFGCDFMANRKSNQAWLSS